MGATIQTKKRIYKGYMFNCACVRKRAFVCLLAFKLQIKSKTCTHIPMYSDLF